MKTIKQWFREIFLRPSSQDMAILELADYLEKPNHDQYKVKQHIMEILGIEFIKDETNHTS